MVSEDEIRRKIELIVRDKIELVRAQGERAFKPLMGIVMKELRGKADGKLISKLLKEKMEEIR
jgi:glutamyl-tRNA(Gln) amidotransferase subunit E